MEFSFKLTIQILDRDKNYLQFSSDIALLKDIFLLSLSLLSTLNKKYITAKELFILNVLLNSNEISKAAHVV